MGGEPLASQVRLVLAPIGSVSPGSAALMMGLVAATATQSRGAGHSPGCAGDGSPATGILAFAVCLARGKQLGSHISSLHRLGSAVPHTVPCGLCVSMNSHPGQREGKHMRVKFSQRTAIPHPRDFPSAACP